MGRQTLHPEDKRSQRFPVSLSSIEAKLIARAANIRGDSVSEFMRAAAKREAERALANYKRMNQIRQA